MVRTHLRAGIVDGKREYVGRPGLSPALAALVAGGILEKKHRILDVGCGRGGDLLSLARMGFRDLVGIDHHRASIRGARRRKGASHVDFRLAPMTAIHDMPRASFDRVLTSFVVNNLPDDDVEEHLAWIARVLPKDGGVIVQSKCGPTAPESRGRGGVASPYFTFGVPVQTWFPEYEPERRGDRWRWTKGAVSGFVQVGRRNGRAYGGGSEASARRSRNARS